MPFKFVFNNEIHRVPKTPKSYANLLQIVKQLYSSDLPRHFSLQYEDSENDRIVLSNNEDFETMIETELNDSSKSVKIYVLEPNDDTVSFISKSNIQSDSEEDMPSKELSSKPLEIIEVPAIEEVPKEQEKPVIEEEKPITEEVKPAVEEVKNTSEVKVEENDAQGNSSSQQEQEHEKRRCMWKFKPHCHGLSFEQRIAHRNARHQAKKDIMKGIAKESFREELPTIALLVKELLQAPNQQADADMKPMNKNSLGAQKKPKIESKAVHNHIICDSCGMNPIIGARYKCTVADDFDLCEKCEALGTHPYPLLKIRTEAQRPYKVITIIDEDEVDRLRHLSELKEMAEATKQSEKLSKPNKVKCSKKVCPKKKDNKKIKPRLEEPKPAAASKEPKIAERQQPVVAEQKKEEEASKGEEFDAEMIKELNQIPSTVTTNDFMVYKTISIRNTGGKAWPKNSFLKSSPQGENTILPEIEAGSEFSTVLIIKTPEQAGKFTYTWKIGYKNEQDEEVFFGKAFTVELEVEEVKAPEVEETPVQKKQYAPEVVAKAKAVKEIFSDKDLDEICEFIEQAPSKSIDEIVEDYLGGL